MYCGPYTLIDQRAASQSVSVEMSLASDLPLVTVDAEQIKPVPFTHLTLATQALP